MIHEHTHIRVKPGTQAAFEIAAQQGFARLIVPSRGYIRHELVCDIQDDTRYLLHIVWQTLENHLVDFRQSPAFVQWRALISPHFAVPPETWHYAPISAA